MAWVQLGDIWSYGPGEAFGDVDREHREGLEEANSDMGADGAGGADVELHL